MTSGVDSAADDGNLHVPKTILSRMPSHYKTNSNTQTINTVLMCVNSCKVDIHVHVCIQIQNVVQKDDIRLNLNIHARQLGIYM